MAETKVTELAGGVMEFGSNETSQAIKILSEHPDSYEVLVVPKENQGAIEIVRGALKWGPNLKAEITEEYIQSSMRLLRPLDPFSGVDTLIELDNAKLRTDFLDSVQTLSSADIHKCSGSSSDNRSLTANNWKKQGKVFAVADNGRDRYPAFQFQDGKPKKIMRTILKTLPENMSPWQTALWFISGNGWLDGRAPMEALDETDAVTEAARQENEIAVG